MKNLSNLLNSKRFFPLFVTQFLGAFNDNFFKNAFVIMLTFMVADKIQFNSKIIVTIAAGAFILPFFIFSATAGQLADKFEKSKIIRITKYAELVLMCVAAFGFWFDNIYVLMSILFMLGTQSAFFGPLKYSILPDSLHEDELIAGNSIIEAGTFFSILIGTILGGILIMTDNGILITSISLIIISLFGLISSYFIPKSNVNNNSIKINYNFIAETLNIVKYSAKNKDVFLSILGISWFWFIGSVLLSQIPSFVKELIGGNEQVVTLFYTLFSLGIALGSLMCNKLLNGEIKASYVPAGAIGISIFIIDLFFAVNGSYNSTYLLGLKEFLNNPSNIRIVLDLFLISFCSGIYIVPLYAIMQSRSQKTHRARVIAANNILNALFMVISSIGAVIMLLYGFSITEIFLALAILNILVAIYICKLLPHAIIRAMARFFLKIFYRIEVKGLENYKKCGERLIIIANHSSMIDAIIIAAFLPVKLSFAINTYQSRRWFIKPLLMLVKAFPIDPTNPMATKTLIDEAKSGNKVVIFPEGRLTTTGSLMKIYEGTAMVVDKSEADILPIRIEGAQYTYFSRLRGRAKLRLFPKVSMTILPPKKLSIDKDIKGRARRNKAGDKLYQVMSEMMFASSNSNSSIIKTLLDAKSIHGGSHVIIEDVNRKPLNYNQLLIRSFILSDKIKKFTNKKDYVGVLLPNMVTSIVTFFALQLIRRVPTMLNYSTGLANIISSCQTSKLKSLLTSKQFIKMAKLEEVVNAIENIGVKVTYLEDIAKEISIQNKLVAYIKLKLPTLFMSKVNSEDDALILFTSGSEGKPKGVVLSHKNILSNINQLYSTIDFGPKDIVFNALPIFHSFGMTGGTLLPILSGVKSFFYPSPLHYRIVPELIYETNSTMMFGTDTFLSGYAKYAHPYDFYSVRYIFAGAEKLKEETRKVYSEKFGVRIFEGYGATETAPVISTNTPMYNKPSTVGRIMPMIEHRLKKVPGVNDGGQLFVKGPNIMKGYLLSSNPGQIKEVENGWYDTGDIVSIDDEGYLYIKGRVKRFAKIAGEMVSLTAVETYLSVLWRSNAHAVISINDSSKGEKLILVTDNKDANRSDILNYIKKNGISELAVPKELIIVDKVPLLGTGKIDYLKVKELVNG